ncbi:MAG: hypothetical protein M2R45_00875 [Verrucomicrobia subdivision 3 bacterium]|nr:hypothetical protein [Limisphaerales bacterium]MCS1414543.1 hypothetical protein [Limisphaerales bacterium]
MPRPARAGQRKEAVVARLPRQQVRAVRLRFWEDRTFLEIARALRVSKPRAHALVQTAIATLRRQLQKKEIRRLQEEGNL